jgi:hypothetical protein
MADPKRTTVTADEALALRDRRDFLSPERYGNVPPEAHEVGAIFKSVGQPRLERGMWVQAGFFIERFFLEMPPS